jgi:hypothetical protein
VYAGVLAPGLAMIGWLTHRDRRAAQFWLVVAGFSLLLALGQATPLAAMMFHVPLYNKFRAPVRNLLVLSFAISVLVGFGVASWQRRQVSMRQLRSALGCNLTIVAASLIAVWQSGGLTWPAPTIILPLGLWAIGSSICLGGAQRRARPQWYWLLLLVVMLDLTSFSWLDRRYPGGFNALGYPTLAAQHRQYLMPSAIVEQYKQRLTERHQRLLPLRGVQETYQNSLADIPPKTSLLWGVPSASGYGPLILSRYQQLLAITELGAVPVSRLSPNDRSLDILAVRYVLTQPLPAMPYWQRLDDLHPNTVVYENTRVLPRTWLVPETIALTSAQVLSAIQTSQLPDGRIYEPSKMALVEDAKAQFKSVVQLKSVAQSTDRADILKLTATHVQIQTDTAAPRFLVLSDIFYPGWQATIDGKPTQIFQTNYVQRGVQVPAGSHLIAFRFGPWSLWLGAGVTLATGVLGVYWLYRIPPVADAHSLTD